MRPRGKRCKLNFWNPLKIVEITVVSNIFVFSRKSDTPYECISGTTRQISPCKRSSYSGGSHEYFERLYVEIVRVVLSGPQLDLKKVTRLRDFSTRYLFWWKISKSQAEGVPLRGVPHPSLVRVSGEKNSKYFWNLDKFSPESRPPSRQESTYV